jgi:hypothetical protein
MIDLSALLGLNLTPLNRELFYGIVFSALSLTVWSVVRRQSKILFASIITYSLLLSILVLSTHFIVWLVAAEVLTVLIMLGSLDRADLSWTKCLIRLLPVFVADMLLLFVILICARQHLSDFGVFTLEFSRLSQVKLSPGWNPILAGLSFISLCLRAGVFPFHAQVFAFIDVRRPMSALASAFFSLVVMVTIFEAFLRPAFFQVAGRLPWGLFSLGAAGVTYFGFTGLSRVKPSFLFHFLGGIGSFWLVVLGLGDLVEAQVIQSYAPLLTSTLFGFLLIHIFLSQPVIEPPEVGGGFMVRLVLVFGLACLLGFPGTPGFETMFLLGSAFSAGVVTKAAALGMVVFVSGWTFIILRFGVRVCLKHSQFESREFAFLLSVFLLLGGWGFLMGDQF